MSDARTGKRKRGSEFYRVAALVGVTCAVYLWGFFRDLPYAPNVDEPTFVARAVKMSSRGNYDPHWFGHPGSTVFYPLSAIYTGCDVLLWGGSLLHPDRSLQTRFENDPADFYALGRCLSLVYAVLGVVATYALGRFVLGDRVALAGAALSIFAPVSLWFGRLVRTDSAGVFFTMVALIACLRILDRDDVRRHVLAGIAIGLAVATRYFMLTLVPVLLAVDAVVLWRRIAARESVREALVHSAVGFGVAVVAFAASTPFFFLDFSHAMIDLQTEAQQSSLGASGLGFVGNLLFYVTDAIPENLGRIQTWLVLAGVGALIWRRDAKGLLLIGFVPVFLAATSLSIQHWNRWIIELSGVLSLIAAAGLDATIRAVRSRSVLGAALLAMGVVATLYEPARAVMTIDSRDSRPSTAVLAREWIVDHLPSRSPIVVEAFGPPLPDDMPHVLRVWRLAESPAQYCARGYRYVALSSMFYGLALSDPTRHATEISIYQELFRESRLLASFPWTPARGGGTVQVYELRCALEAASRSASVAP